MIIKSLGRKAGTRAYGGRGHGRGRGFTAFQALARHMNRGIEDEDGEAILWHNFPGGKEMEEVELVAEFERHGARLADRKNGNVLGVGVEIVKNSTLGFWHRA